MDAVQFPVLFRLLYCCGTRINETLGIKKKDVDLADGIIRLMETKTDCERYIVLGPEIKSLFEQFSDKCFYLFSDDDYIFPSAAGIRRKENRLYDIQRMVLKQASIPYIGGGHGQEYMTGGTHLLSGHSNRWLTRGWTYMWHSPCFQPI